MPTPPTIFEVPLPACCDAAVHTVNHTRKTGACMACKSDFTFSANATWAKIEKPASPPEAKPAK